jgi:DNA-binding IclR family transcriptional regulator
MPRSTQPVQSLTRALRLLEALADAAGRGDGRVGVNDLARRTGLTPGTTHRLLATLAFEGYVAQDDADHRYLIGARMFAIASSAELRLAPLREQAAAVMEAVGERFGETVNLVVLNRRHIVYIDQLEGVRSVRAFNRAGNRVLAHATAAGKALLAFESEAALDAVLGQTELQALTPATITSPAAFRAQLREVKELGYALDLGEQDEDIVCVAAPIMRNGWRPVGALSVTGPAERMRRHDLATVGAELARATAAIAGAGTGAAPTRRSGSSTRARASRTDGGEN